jgi:hypothetical protein
MEYYVSGVRVRGSEKYGAGNAISELEALWSTQRAHYELILQGNIKVEIGFLPLAANPFKRGN